MVVVLVEIVVPVDAPVGSMSEKAATLMVKDGPSIFGKGLERKELQWWSL